tara:strand:+ start:454 stop:759 length:306 start_codon:yes stop_codon:yes gene_type:complete
MNALKYVEETNIPINQLNRMIDTLKDAIAVCYNAKEVPFNTPDTYNESYPYATGYSKSAMRDVLQTLEQYATDFTAEDVEQCIIQGNDYKDCVDKLVENMK